MNKLLYILCCGLSICAFLYMCYISCLEIEQAQEILAYRPVAQIIGTAGWGYIVYAVITRKFTWTKKLCK